MAAFCFAVPYYAQAWWSGPEIPSMMGGVIGLGALVWLTREGQILRKSWIPFLFYGLSAGVATFLLLVCTTR